MWLKLMTSKVGFHKISLKHVPLPNPSLNLSTVRLGWPQSPWEMSTPCTHSKVLTADNCSLRAHSTNDPCLSRDAPSRAQRRLEMCTLLTLSFSVFCNFQTCMSIHRPSKCSEPMLCMNFLQMPTNAGKSGSTLSGEIWGGRLDGVSGTLGFSLERRVSLMLVTMLTSAVGVNRTLLRRLLGGWAFRPRFPTRSIHQPRSVPHCSRDSGSKQTMSIERGSA